MKDFATRGRFAVLSFQKHWEWSALPVHFQTLTDHLKAYCNKLVRATSTTGMISSNKEFWPPPQVVILDMLTVVETVAVAAAVVAVVVSVVEAVVVSSVAAAVVHPHPHPLGLLWNKCSW